MRYRYLGTTGLAVSELALGTMTFGAEGWGCDEKEAHAMIAAYVAAGGNMIDTADVYAKGTAETIIGNYMPSLKRDDILLATKCGFPMGNDPNALGTGRKHILASLEASLRRLKTDYVDIFYLHRHDPSVRAEDMIETLDLAIRQGKVRYAAFSNLPAWRIMLLEETAKRLGTRGFACGQYMYNLADRNCEEEIIPAMLHEGIGFLCWSPLAGGMLTGKYDTEAPLPKGSRFDLRKNLDQPRFWTEHGRKVARDFVQAAAEAGIRPATLAIAWLLSKRYVSSVLIGARTRGQLAESLVAVDLRLQPELMARLDALSEPEKNYLWAFVEQTNDQFRERASGFPTAPIL